jgi:hypothetical protein
MLVDLLVLTVWSPLVAVPGRVKPCGGHDLGHDRPVVPRSRDSAAQTACSVSRAEDLRPVLAPEVPTLTVPDRRVVHRPERIEQLLVGNDGRIESTLDRLGMTVVPLPTRQ